MVKVKFRLIYIFYSFKRWGTFPLELQQKIPTGKTQINFVTCHTGFNQVKMSKTIHFFALHEGVEAICVKQLHRHQINEKLTTIAAPLLRWLNYSLARGVLIAIIACVHFPLKSSSLSRAALFRVKRPQRRQKAAEFIHIFLSLLSLYCFCSHFPSLKALLGGKIRNKTTRDLRAAKATKLAWWIITSRYFCRGAKQMMRDSLGIFIKYPH